MYERLFINVIGEPASGKGYICKYLTELGCGLYTPSTTLRLYASVHDLPLNDRGDYRATHQRLLKEDRLAMVTPAVQNPHSDVAIEGLRCMYHVKALKQFGDVFTVAVECPLEERFRRAMADREGRGGRDKMTLREFWEDEQPEHYNPDPNELSVRSVMDTADFTIDAFQNNKAQVREIVGNIYALLV